MFHYLFTNDLRISNLQTVLTKAGKSFSTNTVPTATENKNENNNMKTLGFYFNLTSKSFCAKECAKGNVREVVINFIKKFQFPNPRTLESLSDVVEDGITVAPMRIVLQVLYNMKLLFPKEAYITKEEILDFIFFNSAVAKTQFPNIMNIIQQIIAYRKSGQLPETIEKSEENRCWKWGDRQIREMVKILLYSGCVEEKENQAIYIKHDNLTTDNKAALFDVLTYTEFWVPDMSQSYTDIRASYEKYMDIELLDVNDALSHNFYGMHITDKNNAVASGEVCIGWSALGDLTEVATKEELVTLMDTRFPNKKLNSKAQDVSQVWTFKDGMSIGDYVVFGDGSNAHIGKITSDYYYETGVKTRAAEYVNNRKVEWLKSFKYTDLPKSFKNSLSSSRSVFSLNAYKSLILELLEKGSVDIDDDEIEEIEDADMEGQKSFIELKFTTNIDCDFERNRIVFGAPGTGKSYQMEQDRESIEKMGGGYERVTFHPDYTYSSFVGCYKPVSEKGKIEYKYVPGPFMRVLVEALRSAMTDTPKPYLLIVEEINRAKVAAVFGEVFQLLDRDSSGVSEYEIHTSDDIKNYLSDELNGSIESFERIRIPNNMFIWATMNSADQGVFPMDTAFKRRWSFEYKGIDENEDKISGRIVLGENEHEFEVDWNILRKAINEVLSTKYNINEDKLIGPFFIKKDVLLINEEGYIKDPEKFKKVFKNKVLMYLYEDAAKQVKNKLFAGCDSTRYSSVCDAFDMFGIDIFGIDFKDTYNNMGQSYGHFVGLH